MAEAVRLRSMTWQQDVLQVINDLRLNQELCDLTISVHGGEQIYAHSCVLASASDFFRSILKDCKDGKITVNLGEFPRRIIMYIVDFVYTGIAVIEKNDLEKVQAVTASLSFPVLAGMVSAVLDKSSQKSTGKVGDPSVCQDEIASEQEAKHTKLDSIKIKEEIPDARDISVMSIKDVEKDRRFQPKIVLKRGRQSSAKVDGASTMVAHNWPEMEKYQPNIIVVKDEPFSDMEEGEVDNEKDEGDSGDVDEDFDDLTELLKDYDDAMQGEYGRDAANEKNEETSGVDQEGDTNRNKSTEVATENKLVDMKAEADQAEDPSALQIVVKPIPAEAETGEAEGVNLADVHQTEITATEVDAQTIAIAEQLGIEVTEISMVTSKELENVALLSTLQQADDQVTQVPDQIAGELHFSL